MRRVAIALAALAACAAALPAEAQSRRRSGESLVIEVRPRSFLDAGRVAEPGSLNRYVTSQVQSNQLYPAYHHQRDRFGEGALPDPITGPFVGARNPFGPIDYPAPAGLRR